MVVLEACRCGGLPAHSHEPTETLRLEDGREIEFPLGTGALNPGCEVVRSDPGRLRIWVDWKAIARAMMTEPDPG